MYACRYPHLACELLTAEVYTIVEKLSSSESLLQLLWSFLDSSAPLDPLVGSFISKVLAMLLNKENINSVVSMCVSVCVCARVCVSVCVWLSVYCLFPVALSTPPILFLPHPFSSHFSFYPTPSPPSSPLSSLFTHTCTHMCTQHVRQ